MLGQLQRDGIAYPEWSMSSDEFFDLKTYLINSIVYNAHVKEKSNKCAHAFEAIDGLNWPVFCTSMTDIVLAPNFFEYTLKGFSIAYKYFGEFPRLYSMNCFWTKRSTLRYEDTHDWHRDGDDRKQLVMFMYGSDIKDPSDGAHLYQKGTNNKENDSALGYDYKNPPENVVETALGRAGSFFFVDTRGLHMGIRPSGLRMLCWARWGVSDPPVSYHWDKLNPVAKELLMYGRYPSNLELQEAIRLVVK